jgi:hypothetical protein
MESRGLGDAIAKVTEAVAVEPSKGIGRTITDTLAGR